MNAGRDPVALALRARLVDARGLCAALQMKMAPRATARQAHVLCPWHTENSPSCSVRVAKDGTLAVRCFACGATGDALKLIGAARGIDDFREILTIAAELANAPSLAPVEIVQKQRLEPEGPSDETYHRIWTFALDALSPMREVSPHVMEYLDHRCIAADAEATGVRGLPRDARACVAALLAMFDRKDLESAGILRHGHDALDWPEWPVCVPWRNRFGLITFVQRRRMDTKKPKYRSPQGRSARAPFGVDMLAAALAEPGAAEEIIISEGAFACLARRKLARRKRARAACLGVYSASSPCAGLPLDLLNGRQVVISTDRDPGGERAREMLVVILKPIAGSIVHERTKAGTGDVDAGDALERRERLQ
jgi:hypothetical protein